MSDESEEARRIRQATRAAVSGHLEAVMARREELLALEVDQINLLGRVLVAARPCGNGCCTGG